MDSHRTRIIRFYPKQTPELMPWLDAQRDKKLSIILLIKMAQQAFGNKDVADALASRHNMFMTSSAPQQGLANREANRPKPNTYENITSHRHKSKPEPSNNGDDKKLSSAELGDLTGGKKW